jgi:hypothetical protein
VSSSASIDVEIIATLRELHERFDAEFQSSIDGIDAWLRHNDAGAPVVALLQRHPEVADQLAIPRPTLPDDGARRRAFTSLVDVVGVSGRLEFECLLGIHRMLLWARPTSQSSLVSIASVETRRISDASSGKIPTTSVRRPISRLKRVNRLVDPSLGSVL